LSLNQIVVSFNLLKQKTFNHGQIDVALSRVTSLSGLYLIGTFKESAISMDERAKHEYENLRENQNAFISNVNEISNVECITTRSV